MRIKLLLPAIGIVLTVACSCQTAHNKLTEHDFTLLYIDSLEKNMPDAAFDIVGPLEIKVKANQEDITVYLDNAYRAYQNEPDAIATIIRDYINSTASASIKTRPINKNSIVPVIRSFKYLEDLESVNHGDTALAELIYYEKYNDDLIILYAEDTEYNVRYLNETDIDTLQIGKDTLQHFAFGNLRKILPEVEIVGANGNFSIVAGGIYETSLILSNSMWNKTNFPVDGDIVIVIPTRDMVYVTGSNNKEHISELAVLARQDFENENYQVSPHLYRYNVDHFERL